ncbi:MAG: chemotaxis protein CheA [Dehalococcoidia bacterium]
MTFANDITPDDLKVFMQEAESLLELLDEDIIRLEQESDNSELLQEIFRAAHTLKGSSGMLGFQLMAGLTHAMEDLLDRVRKGTLPVTPEIVDALLASLDGLKVLMAGLADGEEATLDIEPLVSQLRAIIDPSAASGATQAGPSIAEIVAAPEVTARIDAAIEAGTPVYHVTVHIDPESDWAAVRCFQALNELTARGEVIASIPSQQQIEDEQVGKTLQALFATAEEPDVISAPLTTVADVVDVSVVPWSGAAASEAPTAAEGTPATAAPAAVGAAKETGEAGPRAEAQQSVRIDVDRLDQLMNMVGELVIDRTRIAQISRMLLTRHKEDDQVRALAETSAHIVRVVDELHTSMMQVRMLPVGLLFSKFPRLVRDLSRSTGKQVRLVVEGEGTEIDRSVIEKIKDPLVHLIRNSIDHGVEPLDVRRAAGKPDVATVRLAAQHESGSIVITIDDDGGGINIAAVRAAAVRRGALTPEAAERISDDDALQLIWEPGLSTAQRTTEVSGRGVGMDIVRRDVEALNGRVDVSTEPGMGTRFTLRLPLTLATFGGLLVRSGNAMYALPLSYVQETVRTDSASVGTVMTKSVMNLRGDVMPLLRLREAISRTGTERAPLGDEPVFAVVVKAGDGERDRPVAVVVDELVDQQEIVVKSLGEYLGKTRGVAGASILGDGEVVLIVDVPTLIKDALQGSADASQDAGRKAA